MFLVLLSSPLVLECCGTNCTLILSIVLPLKVWAEMLADGIKPGAHAWSSLVNAHARAGRVRHALELGKQMRDEGHPWCVVTYTSLIAACTRKRNYQG